MSALVQHRGAGDLLLGLDGGSCWEVLPLEPDVDAARWAARTASRRLAADGLDAADVPHLLAGLRADLEELVRCERQRLDPRSSLALALLPDPAEGPLCTVEVTFVPAPAHARSRGALLRLAAQLSGRGHRIGRVHRSEVSAAAGAGVRNRYLTTTRAADGRVGVAERCALVLSSEAGGWLLAQATWPATAVSALVEAEVDRLLAGTTLEEAP
ncbi:hypothetical protein [Kineococcus glutinatus]|uniref:ESAT-6 protein secretion system EspG family protein n=1 Tax=Kineococcus glutinatus TaxID=1070872 RepID=A0ABP9IBZ5_9ACTN